MAEFGNGIRVIGRRWHILSCGDQNDTWMTHFHSSPWNNLATHLWFDNNLGSNNYSRFQKSPSLLFLDYRRGKRPQQILQRAPTLMSKGTRHCPCQKNPSWENQNQPSSIPRVEEPNQLNPPTTSTSSMAFSSLRQTTTKKQEQTY